MHNMESENTLYGSNCLIIYSGYAQLSNHGGIFRTEDAS